MRSIGGGARSYLRDTVVEPGGEGCLTIVFLDPMSYDMGKRPTVIGELERKVEASYGKAIYFKTRLAGVVNGWTRFTLQKKTWKRKSRWISLTRTDPFSIITK